MTQRKYPHCVIAWERDGEGGISQIRLLSASEFHAPKFRAWSWCAYRPDGIEGGPLDRESTKTVKRFGLEALILQTLMNFPSDISADQFRTLRKDLQRLGIDGWGDTP